MRLMNVETLLLEEFYETQVPRYAILSHTWGNSNEELHFADMKTLSKAEKLERFPKIAFLCCQAMADGYEWAWCDTCCIDKSSSAELSESTNSMYRWYGNANLCYAYLQDVFERNKLEIEEEEEEEEEEGEAMRDLRRAMHQVHTDPDKIEITETTSERTKRQIHNSSWFSRGSTLRELLAPESIHFYDRNGRLLGDKKSLHTDICLITGIDDGVLYWPTAIPSYSIATRLSWASKRTTTRPEDRAYCMLGILVVHIPLLYGEGQNAFLRLQEELIRKFNDQTIFAHSGHELLASSPEDFRDARGLTVLPTDSFTPFTITNTGLRIRIRTFDLPALDSSCASDVKYAMGILQCHDANLEERNHCLGLVLERTSDEGIFRKSSVELRSVTPMAVRRALYQDIHIQVQRRQQSIITLRENHDDGLITSTLTDSFSGRIRRVNSRVIKSYPHPADDIETLEYIVKSKQTPSPYTERFAVLFEPRTLNAGVMALSDPSNLELWSAGSNSKHQPAALYRRWLLDGREKSCNLPIREALNDHHDTTRQTLQVSIKNSSATRQPDWTLSIVETRSTSKHRLLEKNPDDIGKAY